MQHDSTTRANIDKDAHQASC